MLRRLTVAMLMFALMNSCATPPAPSPAPPDSVPSSKYAMQFAGPGGYAFQEAKQFVEFCVELDNQDDRQTGAGGSEDSARVDPAQWESIYDSRQALAEDYFRFKALAKETGLSAQPAVLPDDDVEFWKRLFTRIEKTANSNGIVLKTPSDIQRDPRLNGFGPWENAWMLYRGVGRNAGRYAIAIRGTVFTTDPSAIENALFQPVEGRNFLTHAVSFARDGNATVHSGFAHAAFTLLLDRRYGVLPVITDPKNGVPPGSVLYIVGHSQGAAMVTLAHAFLFTAMRDAETSGQDPLGLRGMGYRLKSYGFAQPKPGNYSFSAEFASYTQGPDNAIVINNDLDPVPQVPFTLQSTADLAMDFHGRFLLARAVSAISAPGKWIRSGIGKVFEWETIRSATGYGHFYHWPELQPLLSLRSGASWGFVPAGRVITVFGPRQTDQGKDPFFQHHATTYRVLIDQQLATPP
jgi:lipase (class 3)